MTYIEKELEIIEKESTFNLFGRKEIFTQQLLDWGFHDGHTFDLRTHLVEIILPRLKRFKELASNVIVIDFPLDDMIEGFEAYLEDGDLAWSTSQENIDKFNKGMEAFAKYFLALWW